MRRIINLVEAVEAQPELTPEILARFAKYKLQPEDIAFYIKMAKGSVEGGLAGVERDKLRSMLSRARDKAVDRIIPKLADVMKSGAMLSPRMAHAVAANDDELFNLIVTWVTNGSDAIEDDAQAAAKIRAFLLRVKPVQRHLFRGEGPRGDAHERGFHSWSGSRRTAEMFAERTGRVLEINEPVQALSIGEIVMWRMRVRQGESHYSMQAEWLVIDPKDY